MKRALFTTFFLLLAWTLQAQCPTGTIGATGPGCGCLSGCDLTPLGGPNCSPSVSGNCNAGQVPFQVDIPVPAGCTFTVFATIGNRPTCSSSGADSGDRLKVDIIGGVKPMQSGSSNATLNDNFILAGPGTIRISGNTNRADEIITYNTVDGGTCPSCIPLAVDWLNLSAESLPSTVQLNWTTAQEINSDFFVVERAEMHDGDDLVFEPISQLNAAGNSDFSRNYTIVDSDPIEGNSIYRIKQVDLDGTFEYSSNIEVTFAKTLFVESLYPNPSSGLFHLEIGGQADSPLELTIVNTLGQVVWQQGSAQASLLDIDLSDQAAGIYLLTAKRNGYHYQQKLIRK